MRLIDADALRQEIESKIYWGQISKDNVESLDEIDDAPTVDAVPVVHGEWKVLECDGGEPGGYAPYIDVECSNCGLTVGIEQGQYDWAYGDPFPWKCCPFCEAKMDGGNEE